MKYLKIVLTLLWRLWFYILMFSTIILLSPILLILTSNQRFYPSFWKLARMWCYVIVYGIGCRIKIEREQEIDPNKSYMFCANHISMLDPWVMVILSKNPIVFVGKKELVKIPLFGFFYKRAVIMVDRSSTRSRKRVYDMAKERLVNGTSVAIFPEGLVPEEDVVLAPFKNGAFKLAIEHQIPIVPQVYYDGKRLFSWNPFTGGPGVFRVKQLKFIETKGYEHKDFDKLKEKTFNLLHNELTNDELYMRDTHKAEK